MKLYWHEAHQMAIDPIDPIDPMFYYAFNSWGIAEGRQKTKKDWIRM